MAYNIHFTSTAISKNGNTYQLDIYEIGYVGSIVNIPVAVNPFILKVNASSDNQYEPLLASELRVHLDITDYQNNFIDFGNQDQFKYFGKLTYSGNIVFQGWLLPDAMTTLFTTGRIECSFSFIDGLSMLKTIYYTPYNLNSTVLESTKLIILNCLNALKYPFGFKMNVAVSIFATAMVNRTADISNEPLSQSYMFPSNWFNSEQLTTPNVDPYYFSDYISCYDVLNYLMLGWGCQLYQANGEWVIANVNEMASSNIYLTKYDEAGTYVSAANQSINYTIKPYNLSNNLHFIDNTQSKILRQGFSQIYFKTPAQFSVNSIDNGYLRRLTGGLPDSWVTFATVTDTATFHIGDTANYYELFSSFSGGPAYVQLKSTSTKETNQGDIINISFKYKVNAVEIPDAPTCVLRLELVYGSTTYYYSNNNTWDTIVSGVTPNYYQVKGNNQDLVQNSFNVSTTPVPIGAQYYFSILLQNGFGGGPRTQDKVQFSDFKITFSNNYSYQLDAYQKTANYQNRKSVQGYVGAGFVNNYNAIGAIINYYGQYTYDGWYRQDEGYLLYSRSTLIGIVAENYYFLQSKAQINIEGSLMSLMSKKTDATTTSHLSLFSSFKIDDITTGSNSLTGRYYILGNCEFDLINDILSNVTLLETSKTRLDSISKNIVITVS